jgi:hypothetical protein
MLYVVPLLLVVRVHEVFFIEPKELVFYPVILPSPGHGFVAQQRTPAGSNISGLQ